MYTKFIPKKIQEKLKARERALAYKESNANEPVKVGDVKTIRPKDIQSRTTFVRMCSNKVEGVKNIVISGGKRNPDDGTMKFGFMKRRVRDGAREEAGDVYENRKSGIRPSAGIKSIEVGYKGSWKAIREATINWVVGSIEELDELTPYFLTVGKTVILDWGWANSNVKNFSQMFDDDPFITWKEDADGNGRYNVDQNVFTNVQSRVQKMGGDYDAIGGKVSNFESTMRADGGFDCVTKVTAIGSTLFSKPIDKPTNQISIIPKPIPKGFKSAEEEIYSRTGITDEERDAALARLKDPKSVTTDKGTDNLINAIINLKKIIIKKVFNWTADEPKLSKKSRSYIVMVKNHIETEAPEAFEANHSVYLPEDGNHGLVVDDPKNPQVCWMNIKGKEDFFVKWGWMEDQLMNRYLAYDAGEGTGAGIKITFRSIKTKIDGEGKPILNTIYKEKLDNAPSEDPAVTAAKKKAQSRAINAYYGGQMYTIVDNDSLSKIAAKYQIEVSEILELNDIENPNQISVGQEIMLPSSAIIPAEETTYEDFQNLEESSRYTSRNPDGFNIQQGTGGTTLTEEAHSDLIIKDSLNALNADESAYGGTVSYFDNISSVHAQEFEKESTTIKNNKSLLYPIDPFTFWSQELLPPRDRIKDPILTRPAGATESNAMDTKGSSEFYTQWKTSKILSRGIFTPNTKVDNKIEYTEHLGILRNMWVNIKEIQKAFGVDLKNIANAKANPPGTFEKGIKALLKSLNNNFHGIWDFELAIDPYDSTNMGVVDKKVNSVEGTSLKYTTFKHDTIKDEKEGTESHEVQDPGIYKFPSFKAGSIVKNQSLSFKIPDSMALTIMYGSNKPNNTKHTNNAGYNNPALMKLFNNNDDPKFDDMFLKDMMPANASRDATSTAQNVGSINTHPNSKIIKGEGVTLTGLEKWIREWTGEDGKIKEAEVNWKLAESKYSFKLIDGKMTIVLLKERTLTDDPNSVIEGFAGFADTSISEEDRYIIENKSPPYYQSKDTENPLLIIPEIAKLIRSKLNGSIKQEEEGDKFLKVDTIIPAELSLEIDGIGGIVPGDVIHTNYIQNKYGADIKDKQISYGPFTYFQIVGLNQKVDASSWTTELTTKMKINHIPNKKGLVPDVVEDLPELIKKTYRSHERGPEKVDLNKTGTVVIPSPDDRRGGGGWTKETAPVYTGEVISPEYTEHGFTSPTKVGIPVTIETGVQQVVETEQSAVTFGTIDPVESVESADTKIENTEEAVIDKTYVPRKRISTFPGWFARDGYLYDKYIYAPRHHANWRPKYRYPDGSTSWKSSKFIDGQLYDFFEGGDELDTSVVEVKEMRDEDEIQSYWDGYIEEPSNSGRTALRKDGSSPTLEKYTPGLMIGGKY